MNRNKDLLKEQLPHSFLAEKTLLSCLLINLDAIEITTRVLPIEAFYFKNHQEIYRAISDMYTNQYLIDILSLTTFLEKNGLLTKVGGIKVLIELTHKIPNLIYLEDYIRLVKEKFIRRSLIKLGHKMINSSYGTNLPLEHFLKKLENELFTLTNQTFNETSLSNSQLLNTIFTDIKVKFLNPGLPGLSSGFENLDAIIQGFQKSDLIIIAGRPSMGKTALSLNIGLNAIKLTKSPIVFFTLEMSREQIMYRLLSLETSLNALRLKNGQLYQNDWIKLTKTIKILSKLPFFIEDSSNLSIQTLRSKLSKICFQHSDIGLVIIDYLQLMTDTNLQNENRAQELSKITRALKILAREFNIPIIVLSQLNRNVDNRLDRKPILSDLRESGSIEQDADLILLLYHEKDESYSSEALTKRNLSIAKHRNGPIGQIKFHFDSNLAKFTELSIEPKN